MTRIKPTPMAIDDTSLAIRALLHVIHVSSHICQDESTIFSGFNVMSLNRMLGTIWRSQNCWSEERIQLQHISLLCRQTTKHLGGFRFHSRFLIDGGRGKSFNSPASRKSLDCFISTIDLHVSISRNMEMCLFCEKSSGYGTAES